jgi:hypothetical protein
MLSKSASRHLRRRQASRSAFSSHAARHPPPPLAAPQVLQPPFDRPQRLPHRLQRRSPPPRCLKAPCDRIQQLVLLLQRRQQLVRRELLHIRRHCPGPPRRRRKRVRVFASLRLVTRSGRRVRLPMRRLRGGLEELFNCQMRTLHVLRRTSPPLRFAPLRCVGRRRGGAAAPWRLRGPAMSLQRTRGQTIRQRGGG